MNQSQLCFDDLFNPPAVEYKNKALALKLGARICVINKATLETEFCKVTNIKDDEISILWEGICPINNAHTILKGLEEKPDYLTGKDTIFENDTVIFGVIGHKDNANLVQLQSGLAHKITMKHVREHWERKARQLEKTNKKGGRR